MAQFTIKWPNGAEVTYEGDVSFETVRELLDRDPPRIATTPASATPRIQRQSPTSGGGEEPENIPEAPRVDFAYLDAQLQEVGARTDVERITVLAQVAIDAGAPGLDIATAENWYRELALRMPGVWRSTFANAQARGYLRREGRGLWRPTSAGENFARRGERRPSPARRRARQRT
jgi:hypothetical protein